MEAVTCFFKSRLLRGSWLEFNRQCSTSAAHFSMKKLLDTVALGVGSLEDMEANLEQMNIRVTTDLTIKVIHACKTLPAKTGFGSERSWSRRLLRFFMWSFRRNRVVFGDDAFNSAIQAFSELKDLTSMGIAISELQKAGRRMDVDTFVLVSDTLVKLGKANEAVCLFRNMVEKQVQLPLPHEGGYLSFIIAIVHSLCSKGYARKAEDVVWHHKNKIQDKTGIIYMSLLHGWCIYGNVKEAKRILKEMKSLGVKPGLASYNDLLHCICKRNLKFNPSCLVSEATEVMMEMRSSGVTPTTISFNILLSCLSRARRVKEACSILFSMMKGEEESCPDQVSYYIVLRVLYLTKRIIQGNRIVEHMIKSGIVVEARIFHSLIGILCGIENVNCALAMFDLMKRLCKKNIGKMYDLLIEKLCRNGNFDAGRCLYVDAVENGVILQISKDLLNPSKTEVFKPMRSQKKFALSEYKQKVLQKRRKYTNIFKSKS